MIKHVSEIKDSELEPIRKLVEDYNELYSNENKYDTERDIAFAIIELFTIKNKENEEK